MPIKIQNDLPAREILEKENIFVVDEKRALHQDIRPLQICILNLMPLKEDTELQLLRALSNTPLQIDVSFMRVSSHQALNTSPNHLNRFYSTWEELKDNTYDGMIITGAPVEQLSFEEVDYWDELCRIFEWTKENVTSTFHICWGAQAGLYYHYGLKKIMLSEKLFGIYRHKVLQRKVPLVRGFDDIFLMPHSRYTAVPARAIHECKDLVVLAESDEAGVMLCMSRDGKQIFSMGHAEYDRLTLDKEYRRDVAKDLDIDVPKNYYPENDPDNKPLLEWRSHCDMLYSNWLNYYVYQNTPYMWGQILDEGNRRKASHMLTERTLDTEE
ncbi:MAG: homoserine O-succinyltransferase [Butyrivibrio sp.]|nr:homoserine O-succinyltransferase [Butyrivibrio sp.]